MTHDRVRFISENISLQSPSFLARPVGVRECLNDDWPDQRGQERDTVACRACQKLGHSLTV